MPSSAPAFADLLARARRDILMGRPAQAWHQLALCQDQAASQPDPASAQLAVQALDLRLRAMSAPAVALDCVAEAQRLDKLTNRTLAPATCAEIAITLGEVFGRLGLEEPALSAFERARAWLQSEHDGEARVLLDLSTANALLRCGLQAEAIALLQPRAETLDDAELRQLVCSQLGSAHYFLAEAGAGDVAAHRDASLYWHARSQQDAEAGGQPHACYRAAVNLAIGHARRGDLTLARQYLRRMQGLLDLVWPPGLEGSSARSRAEQASWMAYIEALIALGEGERDRAMQGFQTILAEFRDVSINSYLGMLQLRVAELLVSTAHEAGLDKLAYQAQLELQALQERRNRQRQELSSRLLADALSLSRLRVQNDLLQQHGNELQAALAQRHQELTLTLDQLRAEASIRQATEAALQQAHDELERRVRERSEQLHQTLQALAHQERQAAMAHIVVGVAHELNTPLGNALLALSTEADATADLRRRLADGQLKRAELHEFLALLDSSHLLGHKALTRAADLVQRFKELSVQQMPEPRQRFDPRRQIEQALQRWQGSAGASGVAMRAQLQTIGKVDSYPGALLRILDQLIDNALTHAFEPPLPAAPAIEVRLAREAEGLELCVQDNGRGIASELRGQVFTPFMTTARAHGHAGLGLHVVQVLVQEQLGGRLSVDAAWPSGTCVRVLFPAEAPLPNRAPAPAAPSGTGP
ncbi:HAMP domain-containing sensor histidine kinase [Paucibacter soli]|uniref:HAMP domain-containing sensor histidine kinase n=1 Tax=Paucibacter soli TaxID=3133433 RepID=UPI0030B5E776